MIRYYEIQDHQLRETENASAQLHVYVDPDENEKKYLVEQLKIDEHTLLSALDPDELSRLEFEPDHVAMVFKRPRNYSGGGQLVFKVASTGAFLFKDKLIVVVAEDVGLFESKQFRRIQRLHDLMLKLLYGSIFHFLGHLKVINMIVDDVESKINTAMENRYLINLFALEKSMVYYLNSIHSNGVLIERIRNYSTKLGLNEEEIEFLDDMIIDNSQCAKQADIYSNILASLMDARASIVGNNLNVLMKALNIITIGIMVPTFVVSAFSMNVDLPFNNKHPFAFWGIILLALMSVLAFYLFLRRKKW